jgi:hypothetical protein
MSPEQPALVGVVAASRRVSRAADAYSIDELSCRSPRPVPRRSAAYLACAPIVLTGLGALALGPCSLWAPRPWRDPAKRAFSIHRR